MIKVSDRKCLCGWEAPIGQAGERPNPLAAAGYCPRCKVALPWISSESVGMHGDNIVRVYVEQRSEDVKGYSLCYKWKDGAVQRMEIEPWVGQVPKVRRMRMALNWWQGALLFILGGWLVVGLIVVGLFWWLID